MPKSRGRRPKRPNQRTASGISKDTPTTEQHRGSDNTRQAYKRLRVLDIWKNVWAILGPVIALTGFAFLLWPQIKIESSANPNPSDPLGTEFVVINSGNVPVYDLRFECIIAQGGRSYIGHIEGNMATIRPAPVLKPGEPLSRSCAISAEGSQIPNMQLNVSYKWPFMWKQSTKRAFFKVIRGTNGIAYLVPDLSP
jgi:hypothetical protein